ncbi:T9SS type A sorting domain-containing protein [Flavobacterium sp. 3HN19-14]|uniref:T9SS type A sorting domain-containing protein n=1 Tax=Flavobacterium sp. 3HN19-14 TaxID=3448133 RepID=UPI003EDEA039
MAYLFLVQQRSGETGNKVITYYYTVNGCNFTISDQINVSSCVDPNPAPAPVSCPPSSAYNTIEPYVTANYQATNTITVSGNYALDMADNITMRAGTSIDILPNTNLQFGSEYLAIIQPCVMQRPLSAEETANDIEVVGESITIYPNPTDGKVTLISKDADMAKVRVTAIDGKLVYDGQLKGQRSIEINLSDYGSGIYIISIETSEGRITRKKIIKN